MRNTLIFIFIFLGSTVLTGQDDNWIHISSGGGDPYSIGLETAYLKMYLPPRTEYWEDRGNSDFDPLYILTVDQIYTQDDLFWGRSVPLMVVGGEVAGSYRLIEEKNRLAYEMEIQTGDYITRITLESLVNSDFLEMTKQWLSMISSVEYQENAPAPFKSLKERFQTD